MKAYALLCAADARSHAFTYGYYDWITQHALGRLSGYMIATIMTDVDRIELIGIENECRFLGGEYRERHGL